MTLRLPRGNKAIVYFSFIWICTMRILEMVGIPHFIEYILDISCVLMFVLSIQSNWKGRQAYLKPVVLIQIIIFLIGSLVSIINGTSLLLIAWAWRKMFRYLVFFVSILLFFNEKDIKRMFPLIEILSYVNFIMVLVELYFLGYMQDCIGGIFGTLYGLNGDLNNFMLLLTIIMITRWTYKRVSFSRMVLHIAMCIAIAVIAELKAFFVELVIVGIICSILYFKINNLNVKKLLKWLWAGAAFFVLLYTGTIWVGKTYDNFQDFFTMERIIYEVTREEGYNSSGDINRLTFLNGLNERISSQKGLTTWIGHGFGSWEMSDNNDSLSSDYYKMYRWTSYSFFSLPWMYLEVGMIGMIAYILGFILNAIQGYRILKIKAKHGENTEIVFIGVVTSIMSLFILVYNSSLRTISGFLIYFGLALVYIPLVKNKQRYKAIISDALHIKR